ncbi:MAG: hypothetical protein ACRCXZ_09190 [Patescibacteria group bacterium]
MIDLGEYNNFDAEGMSVFDFQKDLENQISDRFSKQDFMKNEFQNWLESVCYKYRISSDSINYTIDKKVIYNPVTGNGKDDIFELCCSLLGIITGFIIFALIAVIFKYVLEMPIGNFLIFLGCSFLAVFGIVFVPLVYLFGEMFGRAIFSWTFDKQKIISSYSYHILRALQERNRADTFITERKVRRFIPEDTDELI